MNNLKQSGALVFIYLVAAVAILGPAGYLLWLKLAEFYWGMKIFDPEIEHFCERMIVFGGVIVGMAIWLQSDRARIEGKTSPRQPDPVGPDNNDSPLRPRLLA